jgi:hypothetical protein
MTRGRPSTGPELVNKLDGSELAKQRLMLFLQTLSGSVRVPDACATLGISEARFHEQRNEWLQGSVGLLEPKPAGRPAQQRSAEEQVAAVMEQQINCLKLELQAAQIREEIALVMPHLLQSSTKKSGDDARRKKLEALDDGKKKTSRQRRLDALQDALNSTENA